MVSMQLTFRAAVLALRQYRECRLCHLPGTVLDWSFGAFLSESDPEKPDDLTMNRSLLPLGGSPDALVEIVRDA